MVDPGRDLIWGTTDDQLGNNTGQGHAPWSITDGGAGDLDGLVNGKVQTSWYVDPDDSLGARFLLTVTGSAPAAITVKTDAPAPAAISLKVDDAPAPAAITARADDAPAPAATNSVSQTSSVTTPAVNSAAVEVATTTFTDSNPLPVQFFYVPKTEAQLFLALQTIEGSGAQEGFSVDPVNPVYTYISIAAVANGTVIYYDHWEDGYETNLANPTQSSTQIWGDGILGNGVAPGTVNDLINAGTVLVLQNAVDTSLPPVATDYDGGDKVGATKTVAMTRIGWASGSDTLLTSGLEVFDTSNYGTDYKIPVGVDIPDATDFQIFEYTGIFIQAGQLGATVNIDADANGSLETQVILSQGESYLVNGGVNVGARVISDNPVQVGLLTGDIGSNYESRDAALLPLNLWSNSYYTPVSTPHSVVGVGGSQTYVGTDTTVWLYNPGTSAISVNFEYRVAGVLTTAVLSVPGGPAGGYLKQIMPDGSGGHFSPRPEKISMRFRQRIPTMTLLARRAMVIRTIKTSTGVLTSFQKPA
ncbi:MAG: hypothetical protein IPK02_12065 [Candidatus Accumulibacter sp.]|uniref:Uncharacterized protein n=1 Tax=Candidatus Accumulibacter affinis TaxID=2954384 RepID=A0A935TI66_9PROT|nr:hypothetical protein [Candidatus Accumulibacter affinis]